MRVKQKIQFLLFLFTASLFAQPQKTIKNSFLDITDVSISKLKLAESDKASLDDYHYQQEVFSKENELKKKLSSKRIKAKNLNGNWRLYDNNTKTMTIFGSAGALFAAGASSRSSSSGVRMCSARRRKKLPFAGAG